MANIALVKVTNEWKPLEELVGNGFTFDSSITYVIEGRGNGGVLLIEKDTVPEPNSKDGTRLDGLSYKIAEYKVGTGILYARLDTNSLDSGVNISTKEED